MNGEIVHIPSSDALLITSKQDSLESSTERGRPSAARALYALPLPKEGKPPMSVSTKVKRVT